MDRAILKDIKNWFKGEDRKPLVIRGARQVGKTWVVREFARRTGRELIEINFERHPEYADFFKKTSPTEVLASIERQTGLQCREDNSLLFLDEIQKAPQAFANLRWFYEEKPHLPIVATGSLLDFVLSAHEFSMPVGRISYLFMEPMSFKEFLIAHQENIAVSFIESFAPTQKIEDPFHRKLTNYFKDYLIVGGLPAAVQSWTHSCSPVAVSEIHQNLLNTYSDDFNKYSGRIPTDRLRKVFRFIPRTLGQKFKYSKVDREERSGAIKQALDMLCLARVCHKVTCSHGRGIPLSADEDEKIFKVILLDTGLALAGLGVIPRGDEEIAQMIRVNEGGISEQVVGQILRTIGPGYVDPVLHYYVREQKGSEAELDYLLQTGTEIVPVEVKSGATGQLKSLHQFMAERKLSLAVRLNTDKSSLTDLDVKTVKGERARYKLISLPFYMISEIPRLLHRL